MKEGISGGKKRKKAKKLSIFSDAVIEAAKRHTERVYLFLLKTYEL